MAEQATPTTRPRSDGSSDVSHIVVKCVGLTKVFKDFWLRDRVKAVDHIDLEVHRGEVFGLLGPNGSGKSTTIKMLLGLLHPTAGRIAVFHRPPTDVSIKRRIGYLPEESYLYRFLNARETLDYYGRLFHQDRRQRHKRIDMLLEMVGLDRVARRPVGEYSKGMQRRIGLAQALINDPELLILDEPTTGLDPLGTRQIKDLILELARRGKTVLLCSHLLADVEDVCDRVAIMFGGKIRKAGRVEDLLVQEGVSNIQTRSLPEDVINEIEQVLEKHGRHIERVEHPRQRLESLFLDIVHEAQTQGAETSGAGAGGRIAEFLTGGAAAAGEEGEQLIDRLVQPRAEPTPATTGAGETSGAEAAAGPTPEPAPSDEAVDADIEVIDELLGRMDEPTEKPPAAPPGASAEASKPQAPSQAPAETPSPAAKTGTNDEGVHVVRAEDSGEDVELPEWATKPTSESPETEAAGSTATNADEDRAEVDEEPDKSFLDALINAESGAPIGSEPPEADEPRRDEGGKSK